MVVIIAGLVMEVVIGEVQIAVVILSVDQQKTLL